MRVIFIFGHFKSMHTVIKMGGRGCRDVTLVPTLASGSEKGVVTGYTTLTVSFDDLPLLHPLHFIE